MVIGMLGMLGIGGTSYSSGIGTWYVWIVVLVEYGVERHRVDSEVISR